ncbi:transmembrane protein, putative (macronuclear) [Tetrahymena thermophila SB210]|uniref:Transmembrane protein, putative n=1 Tax=Tetrahymena thermophila (strain SB210) TaxID=312017 RepID=W7XB02_TETTS|nr:transmembrane protein, putative [Tetrahymena thermophila SB210]EWS73603.1 transmembrane protein, putative [Tetrahymena thermophila SB210]|eukprot:XP_012653833.1 transmembrane protein, putative [Tetrahymena thermophila SB210]
MVLQILKQILSILKGQTQMQTPSFLLKKEQYFMLLLNSKAIIMLDLIILLPKTQNLLDSEVLLTYLLLTQYSQILNSKIFIQIKAEEYFLQILLTQALEILHLIKIRLNILVEQSTFKIIINTNQILISKNQVSQMGKLLLVVLLLVQKFLKIFPIQIILIILLLYVEIISQKIYKAQKQNKQIGLTMNLKTLRLEISLFKIILFSITQKTCNIKSSLFLLSKLILIIHIKQPLISQQIIQKLKYLLILIPLSQIFLNISNFLIVITKTLTLIISIIVLHFIFQLAFHLLHNIPNKFSNLLLLTISILNQ